MLDRKQFVVVNKACSGIAQVRCGVPQGSILGPLLFILYMNDFNYISNLLKIVMFADDTNLFLTGKDCREIESLFNRELQCISEWFTSNRLSLNVSKTLYLVFSNKNNIQLKLSIGSSLLAKQMDTKFLGVYLSANLSWNKHIDMVVNKISKNVGIIVKVRHNVFLRAERKQISLDGRNKWSDLRTLHVRGYEGHALHACVGVHVVAYISGQNSHFDLCVDKQNRTSD